MVRAVERLGARLRPQAVEAWPRTSLDVEVRIQDRDLVDRVDGEAVPLGGLPDGLWVGPVVHAVRLLLVVTHVGVDPRDAEVRVPADHAETCDGALTRHRNAESIRKRPFDDVTRHRGLLSLGRVVRPASILHSARLAYIGRIPHFEPRDGHSCPRRPSRAASRTASSRLRAPSLARAADTWWSTVLAVTLR